MVPEDISVGVVLPERKADNLTASRYFRRKKREYMKDEINHLAMNSMSKNFRDLYRGINEFKRANNREIT
jgi:hypothetical protein